MSNSSSRSGRGQHALNIVMRGVLAVSLLHRAVSNRVLVLDVRGRKSGRRYRIPVGYTPTAEGLLIGTAGTWRRNLVGDKLISVTVARKTLVMDPEVITDERRCAECYRKILAHNPVHGRYAGIRAMPDGTPDPDDLHAALQRGIAVVQLKPVAGH